MTTATLERTLTPDRAALAVRAGGNSSPVPITLSVPQHLAAVDAVRARLNATLKGKSDVVEQVLICLLSRGHLLIEDRPGLGKTTLAKALADAIGGRFARVQCTPDLLPSDITGFNIFNQKSREFEFRTGPVFSDVFLADEINRATPRTQSALLEAMAERQVTVDAVRYLLSDEFFVIATQNPHDQHGTYPLPEAQLDRFAMKLSVGYPGPADEAAMLAEAVQRIRLDPRDESRHAIDAEGSLDSSDGSESSDRLAVVSRRETATLFAPGQLRALQELVAAVAVEQPVREYVVKLAEVTRKHRDISLGLSPRALLTWQRAAQAAAFLKHRLFVTPDDVQDTAEPVLVVRLGIEADSPWPVIREVMESIPVP